MKTGHEWGDYYRDTQMTYEDIKCPVCHRIGQNNIESGVPVRGHPNVEEEWLICKCGHAIMEIIE